MMQIDGWDYRVVQTRKSEDGPLKYHSQFGWKFDKVAKFLTGPFNGEHPMMIKLVGPDRQELDKLKNEKWPLHNTSILTRYLGFSTST